jgi:hypothetical protein
MFFGLSLVGEALQLLSDRFSDGHVLDQLQAERARLRDPASIVKDDIQKRAVNLQPAVVVDVAEFAEPVHEKVTRERVVPMISASFSWLSFAITGSGLPALP